MDLTEMTPTTVNEILPFLSERGRVELELAVERWRTAHLAAALRAATEPAPVDSILPSTP